MYFMKRVIGFILLLLALQDVAAQKKPASRPPAQSDMKKMMKEMEEIVKEMESEMSDEDKKMMDSLGIKLPDMKKVSSSVSGISDKQLAAAFEEEERIVPKKNTARIAAIPKVTNQTMPAYLKAVHAQVSKALPAPATAFAEKVYNYCMQSKISPAQMDKVSAGFWLSGKTGIAVYLLGKACTQTTDGDCRGNYAAQLSMMGAPHLAIPVLQVLNTAFPKNSTLLNNLGQAWFGLGEIGKAEKYLDSAIAIYPFHPQANLTKSRIEESKGNTTKAIECVKKSIKHSYTKEKEEALSRLGYKLKMNDLSYFFKADSDPLSVNKFKRPDYPMNVEEMKVLKPLWEKFNEALAAEMAKLQKEMQDQQARQMNNTGDMVAQAMQAMQSGGKAPAFMRPPLYARKASLVLTQLEKYEERVQQGLVEKFKVLQADLDKIEKEYRIPAPEAPCAVHRDTYNEYLRKYNTRKKVFDDDVIAARKRYYNEIAYWSQYTSTDKAMYEMIRLRFRISWLQILGEGLYQPKLNGPLFEDCPKEEEEAMGGELQAFANTDACRYKSQLKLGPLKIKSNCNLMSSELDFMFLQISRKDDFDRAEGDNYLSSTVRLSAEIGKDISAGPLKAEAKLGGGVEVAMGRNGVEDVVLIAEAKLGAGLNVLDEYEAPAGSTGKYDRPGIGIAGKDVFPTTVEAGLEGRVSILSGQGNVSGTGALSGIEVIAW